MVSWPYSFSKKIHLNNRRKPWIWSHPHLTTETCLYTHTTHNPLWMVPSCILFILFWNTWIPFSFWDSTTWLWTFDQGSLSLMFFICSRQQLCLPSLEDTILFLRLYGINSDYLRLYSSSWTLSIQTARVFISAPSFSFLLKYLLNAIDWRHYLTPYNP